MTRPGEEKAEPVVEGQRFHNHTGQLSDLQERLDRVEHAVKKIPAESILWQMLAKLVHILHIGVPAVSGTLLAVSWVRRRREQDIIQQSAAATAETPGDSPAESIEAGKPQIT